jgi:hypothetical protein
VAGVATSKGLTRTARIEAWICADDVLGWGGCLGLLGILLSDILAASLCRSFLMPTRVV